MGFQAIPVATRPFGLGPQNCLLSSDFSSDGPVVDDLPIDHGLFMLIGTV